MTKPIDSARLIARQIRDQKLDIYTPLTQDDLYLSNQQLEALIGKGLKKLSFAGLPIRTRSKRAKERVCEILGYAVPKSFKKVRPRFLGQNFDVYVQKSDNLQIWNEEVSPSRRYVIVRVDEDDTVSAVKVVSGEVIAELDTKGTLTQKYQASFKGNGGDSILVTDQDTENLQSLMKSERTFLGEQARFRDLLPIQAVFSRLKKLEGKRFPNPGHTQERNRGAALHHLAQAALSGSGYSDTGQFPDIVEQLVEVKLQTSPTIDLGLVLPNGTDMVASVPFVRHCDVRYAIFFAHIEGANVAIDRVVVSNGEKFFTQFRCFEGKQINKKIQLRLPATFFTRL